MRIHPAVTIAACLLVLVSAGTAHAQAARPERPYRGLFGGGDTSDVRQTVRVSGSLGTGWDTDRAADLRNGAFDGPSGVGGLNSLPPGSLGSGALGQFSGALSYLFSSDVGNLNAVAGTSGRYYPNGADEIIRRDNVGVNGSSRVGFGLSVAGGASYHPYSVSSLYADLLPGDPNVLDTEFDIGSSRQHVTSYNVAPSWSVQLSRRLSANAQYRYSARVASGAIPEHASYNAGGGLRYNLGRGLDLKLGYRYTDASYASEDSYRNHAIDAGVDFQRALSFSRRTTLSFSTGTSAADHPAGDTELKFRVIGDVSLNHEIGRSWSTGVSYSRNMRFDEGWSEPIFTDNAAAQFGGLLNRRIGVSSSAGVSRGRQAFDRGKGYEAYFAGAGMNIALGQYASFGASYRYQFREYTAGYAPLLDNAALMRRQSVHANVSLWAPLYQQKRRP
jgi:opacity protein-like surface antigen